MQELEQIKWTRITVPQQVTRYWVAYYTNWGWWENSSRFFTTPESAIEEFKRVYKDRQDNEWTPRYYCVYELKLKNPLD